MTSLGRLGEKGMLGLVFFLEGVRVGLLTDTLEALDLVEGTLLIRLF